MRLYGKVVQNNDPKKCFRIRVHIQGYNHTIEPKFLDWVEPSSTGLTQVCQAPAIDEIVQIDMTDDYSQWSFLDLKDQELLDLLGDDNLKAIVLSYRNLSKQGSSGKFGMLWTNTNGFQTFINDSKYQIRQKDGSLYMTDGKISVHIVDGKISLGSETKSAESGVLGEKNEDALNSLNDDIKALATSINTFLNALNTAAAANPYTIGLVAPIVAAITQINTTNIGTNYTKTKAKFPKTKSKKVSLD